MRRSVDGHQTNTRMASATPAKIELQAIRPTRNKIYEQVAEQLQKRILEQLKPGDLLPPERELARMLGVSRSSIRDAIRSLELLGLLEPRQGVGTMVRELSAESLVNPLAKVLRQKRKMISELLEVRKMIEPPLARRAALHICAEAIDKLERILARQQEKLRSHELAIEEDSEFHFQIALAADNSVVLKVVNVLMDLLRETRERSLQVEGRQEKALAGHRRIFAALKRHDAGAAESAMRRHLQEIENIVLKKL
jgi:GntR family transcriptional regulator, transcriptional repressor for pyruvate dehydrogenase complex